MKSVKLIFLFLVGLSQFIKADTVMSEPEVLEHKPNGYTIYVYCINGYKYMFFRTSVIQMFKEYRQGGLVESIPISCK